MDNTNLIYNADFTAGTECWSGTSLSVSGNYLSVTGNLTHSLLVPVAPNDNYKISFDIKFNSLSSPNFYISIQPYDSDKKLVNIASINKVSSTNTTLAKELNNGDMAVTLTDGAKWDSSYQYQRIGICNNLAWGYNRNTYSLPYTSREENIITLKTAWSGGTFPAGTKVANFRDGSTYYYPFGSINVTNTLTDWTHFEKTFKGGDYIRYGCQFFRFSTLGYSNNYSIRNLKIENVSNYQICDSPNITPQIYKNGNIYALFNCVGRRIRYIKDSINGSTANTANHWVEIQAYNIVGSNFAFNKDIWTSSNSTRLKTLVTDGSTATSPYFSSYSFVVVDLGFTELIHSIKVWHYWGDGRTYNDHTISVSVDGSHWDIVYSGKHPETSDGFEVKLFPDGARFLNTGIIECNDFIEI